MLVRRVVEIGKGQGGSERARGRGDERGRVFAFEKLEELGWELDQFVAYPVGGVAERDAGAVLG